MENIQATEGVQMMENVQIIGSLVLSGVAIIASALVAIIPPLYNHKKTKQYDKQWDVIAKLYKKLADADLDISNFLSPLQYKENEEELAEKAVTSFNKFARFFLEERIYITEIIANLIDLYLKDVKTNFNANVMARSGNTSDPNLWYKTWEKHQKGAIKASKDEIEEIFRKHLKIRNSKVLPRNKKVKNAKNK